MEEKKTSFEKSEIVEFTKKKPKLKIIGEDGNVFFILGMAQRAAKKAGWEKEKLDKFMADCMSGNYDHVLCLCQKHFEIT